MLQRCTAHARVTITHVHPRYLHSHLYLCHSSQRIIFPSSKFALFALIHPFSGKALTNKCLPSATLFCSYPPGRNNLAGSLSAWLRSRGNLPHFLFAIRFSLDTGGASPCYRELSGTSCTRVPGTVFERVHAHMHIREDLSVTQIWLSALMYSTSQVWSLDHADRHTGYLLYCLSASHSVSSLLPLIPFIIFLHTRGTIPPKLPHV